MQHQFTQPNTPIDETSPTGNGGMAMSLGGDVLGGLVGWAANAQQAKKAYQRQRTLIDEQRAYNTPAMQMQRLKEAGINPHMAYAKGGITNTSTNAGTSVQKGSPSNFKIDGARAYTIKEQLRGMQLDNENRIKTGQEIEARTNNLNSNTGLTDEKKAGQVVANQLLGIDLDKQNYLMKDREWQSGEFGSVFSRLADLSVGKAYAEESNLRATGANIRQRTALTYQQTLNAQQQRNVIKQNYRNLQQQFIGQQLDNQFNRWRTNMATRYGITPNDSEATRVAYTMMLNGNTNPDNAVIALTTINYVLDILKVAAVGKIAGNLGRATGAGTAKSIRYLPKGGKPKYKPNVHSQYRSIGGRLSDINKRRWKMSDY